MRSKVDYMQITNYIQYVSRLWPPALPPQPPTACMSRHVSAAALLHCKNTDAHDRGKAYSCCGCSAVQAYHSAPNKAVSRANRPTAATRCCLRSALTFFPPTRSRKRSCAPAARRQQGAGGGSPDKRVGVSGGRGEQCMPAAVQAMTGSSGKKPQLGGCSALLRCAASASV